MSTDRPRRVMWLLNHGAARRFEIPMLKRAGYNEIFLPKSYPDYGFRSASVDRSEDANLTIPAEDLKILNETDWYNEVPKHVWDIANEHFGVMFYLQHYPEFIHNAARNFKGVMIWRVYGRQIDENYDTVLRLGTRDRGPEWLKSLGERFVFGMAYEHLHLVEPDYLQRRAIYLPLGMDDCRIKDEWKGSDKRLLFVCPDIESNYYYGEVYKAFNRDFGDLPHAVGGVQSIASERPDVLGYLPQAQYERNMREFRAMYYHSLEPNHVHYHPFEAVKVGMPLVFMGGGLLDRLGGKNLPGRATSVAQARKLIMRLQAGDEQLTDRIRSSQSVLLRDMEPEHCAPFWRKGMEQIAAIVDRASRRPAPVARKRIAVLLPQPYRGGSFNAAKLVAEALHFGSREASEPAQVVLGYPEEGDYENEDFAGLPEGVQRRPFNWRTVGMAQSKAMMALAGDESWTPASENYQVPDDGINSFYDCDLWLVISDRQLSPPLPMRPIITLVYDYVQRYFELWSRSSQYRFLRAGWLGDKVIATTEFTKRDAVQFGAIPTRRVARVPMIGRTVIDGPSPSPLDDEGNPRRRYFLWPTNASPHKNHTVAARALSIYYEEMGGTLQCVITGTDANLLTNPGDRAHLKKAATILSELVAQKRIVIEGELSERQFASRLRGADFLWHPAKVDNGTFAVVEAAYVGVPSLSSDYPAMREMDGEFGLALSWASPDDPRLVAEALVRMEHDAPSAAAMLPPPAELDDHSPKKVGLAYWAEVAKLA